jgi:2-polyprenyl-3-methyl-5-hydroxy-6-metoxy-1,4-benzoquinol methylase
VGDEFPDNELQEIYENSASFYDLELNWEYGGHERRLQEIARFFPLRPDRKPRLLDVGCGTGRFLSLAARKGYEVYGTELADLPIRLAKERYGLDINQTNLADDRRDKFYDVITMWGLVEHVQAPGKLITEVIRLLSPAGVVGILTPVVGPYDKLAYLIYRLSAGRMTNLLDHRNNKAHLSILSKRALLSLLKQQGLTIMLAQQITELGLPIEIYLRNIGIRNTSVVNILAAGIRFALAHRLFFCNNILVYARKPA